MLSELIFTTVATRVNPLEIKRGEIEQALRSLKKEIEERKKDIDFKKFFEAFSRFYRYSFYNAILIHEQFPDATVVAGYRQWQKKWNRQVRKGEKGIRILAPLIKKVINEHTGEEEPKLIGYRVVVVFDISQTEQIAGTEIKIETPDETSKIKFTVKEQDVGEYLERLLKFLDIEKIPVNETKMTGFTKGFSDGKRIVISDDLNDAEKLTVLIHEYVHHVLHYIRDKKTGLRIRNPNYSREKVELEAESTVYVVCNKIDIETTSVDYLANWQKKENLLQCLENVFNMSRKILQALLNERKSSLVIILE